MDSSTSAMLPNSESDDHQHGVELEDTNHQQHKNTTTSITTNNKSSGDGGGYHYCVVNEEEMGEQSFSHHYELNKDNYEMFKAILDNFDPDDKLKNQMTEEDSNNEKLRVSDFTFEFVERRFKKYHSKDEYPTYHFRTCIANGGLLIGMTLLIIGFLLLSALPIWTIESGNERIQNNITFVSSNGTLQRVDKWTYGNSVYFCLVTFTTIGYGDMIPSTETIIEKGGRVYIGFFGLIGIAIMGSLLVVVGKTTTGGVKNVLLLISLGLYKIVSLVKKRDERMKKSDLSYRIIFSSIMQLTYYTIFWLGYVFVCAGIFTALEGWSYTESCWYCFVTLATIGYGDFYPTNGGSKIFFMFFAIIGLGFEAIMIGLIAEIVLDCVGRIKKKFIVWKRRRRESKKKTIDN